MLTLTDEEQWKPVNGFEGVYEVSTLGRVRSLARVVKRGRGMMNVSEKILTPNCTPGKYVHVVMQHEGKRRDVDLHVLVAETFLGPRPEKLEVCHNNGDPRDNRLENLRYDTSRENSLDTVKHGRNPQRQRTHCPSGHPLVVPNLVEAELRRGHRKCRACNTARAYVYRNKMMVKHYQEISDATFARITGKFPKQLSGAR